VEKIDAVVLAAGRFVDPEARRAGAAIKALVQVAGTTPFDAVLAALRASAAIDRLIVVAPRELHGYSRAVDAWVDEGATGEEQPHSVKRDRDGRKHKRRSPRGARGDETCNQAGASRRRFDGV